MEVTTLEKYNEMAMTLNTLATRASVTMEPDKALRIELRNARVEIEKIGKFLREDFTRKAKEVIAKEKELIAIVEPQEKRLKSLEEAAELAKQVEYRKTQFDARSERLATLGHTLSTELNEEMDDVQFEAYVQNIITMNNERRERELEAREAKLREAEEAQKREAEMKAREEKAREEEKLRAEREIAEANARAERAAEEERNRIAREADEAKRKEAEEKKKLEQDIAYQTWLESHGYYDALHGDTNEKEYLIIQKEGIVALYKIVGTLTIE